LEEAVASARERRKKRCCVSCSEESTHPEKVAQHAVFRDLAGPLDVLDLLHAPHLGRQAPVDAEDLLAHDGSERKAVEY